MKERRVWIALAVLTGLNALVYGQLGGADFVSYDDDKLVYAHPVIREGLSWESARWAFVTVVEANWAPLTWLSHMLDVSMFGLEAGGHHLTNLALHELNTLLLLGLLYSATGKLWQSAVVAALFGIHPLHVESVAWISERRDVLSTALALMSMWTYVRWTRDRRTFTYLVALILFVFGLMSKAMLVTVPILMMLLDYWPLGRLRPARSRTALPNATLEVSFWRAGVEKVPFLAIAFAASAITLYAQQSGDSVLPVAVLSVGERLSNAAVSYLIYLKMTVWPVGLAVFYPHPSLPGGPEPWPTGVAIATTALLLVVTAASLGAHRRRFLSFGWLWYVVSLLPVIGLIQVGQQAHADRYTYLPLIGVFVAVVWGAGDWVAARSERLPWLLPVTASVTSVLVTVLGVISFAQVSRWNDSTTLFTHAAAVTSGNFTMHYNAANELKAHGEIEAAEAHYRSTLEIHPHMARARVNFGNMLRKQGRLDDAIEQYSLASWDTSDPRALKLLSSTSRERDGTLSAAIAVYREAVIRLPEATGTHLMLGHALRADGQLGPAIDAYRNGLIQIPEDASLKAALEQALVERDTPVPR